MERRSFLPRLGLLLGAALAACRDMLSPHGPRETASFQMSGMTPVPQNDAARQLLKDRGQQAIVDGYQKIGTVANAQLPDCPTYCAKYCASVCWAFPGSVCVCFYMNGGTGCAAICL